MGKETDSVSTEFPALYQVTSPLDVKTLNPAGRDIPEVKQAQDEALQQTENLANLLEARFAQPNWFKVAAGFAKPQLGGFLASIGSASEALGAQQEAARAIMPTVARMRAEVAAGKAGLALRSAQDEAIRKYDRSGQQDLNELRRIISLDPSSPVAESIKLRPEFAREGRAATQFGFDVQKEIQANPSLQITGDPVYKGYQASDQDRLSYIDNINKTVPAGINPENYKLLPFSDKQEAHAKSATASQTQYMDEGQKSSYAASHANDLLDALAPLRRLGADSELKDVFSLFDNGDLLSQFKNYLNAHPGSSMNEAAEGFAAATLGKLKNVSETKRAKFDKLAKGIAEVEMRLRSSTQNPTDAATLLSQQRSPSLANSQSGFVGILDQLGLNAYRDIELDRLRNKMRLTNKELIPTDEYRRFRDETRQLQEDMASKPALDQTPKWFYPTKVDTSSGTTSGSQPLIPTAKSTSGKGQSTSDLLNKLRALQKGKETQ